MADWIQTYTGKQFWPLNPRPEDIDLLDIAHALSNTCRYGGHCSKFYSVAEHSTYVALLSGESYLYGLLHDASEAYLCDPPRPVKRAPEMQFYRDAKEKLQRMIFEKFGLDPDMPPVVHSADMTMFAAEAYFMMDTTKNDWSTLPPLSSLPETPEILYLTPQQAQANFINSFYWNNGRQYNV